MSSPSRSRRRRRLTVETAEPLGRALQLMVEHEVSHVIAIERHSERPIGVVSTLDVARALAGLAA